MNFYSGKPIVQYNRKVEFGRFKIELGKRAYVFAVNHPRLGEQDVDTSQVIEIFTTGDGIQAFETLNTVYVLDTYVIPEQGEI